MDELYDPKLAIYGHPTERLVNFFRGDYEIPDDVFNYLRANILKNNTDKTKKGKNTNKTTKTKKAKEPENVDKPDTETDEYELKSIFLRQIIRSTCCTIAECRDDHPEYGEMPFETDINQWIPPCRNKNGCNPLCRALVARMATLEVAERIVKHNAVPGIHNLVYWHIDAHMPILLQLDHFASMSSDGLCNCGDYPNDGPHPCSPENLTFLMKTGPYNLSNAFTNETLPDLSPLVHIAAVFHRARVSDKKFAQMKFPGLSQIDIEIILFLSNVLYKCLPHRCNNRDYWRLLHQGCDNYFMLCEFFMKMISASLLGIYEKSNSKMPTHLRLVIYRFFHYNIDRSDVLSIMNKINNVTLLYIGKEFGREMAERQPGTLLALKELYFWDTYDTYTTRITDRIRQQYHEALSQPDSSGSSMNDLLVGIDISVDKLHQEYRRSQKQNTLSYNIDEILNICDDLSFRRYDPGDMEVTPGEEHLLPNPLPLFPKETRDLMVRIIETFPTDDWIPMDWLIFFGARMTDINRVKVAVFAKAPTLRRTLLSLSKRAYSIFYNFFVAFKERFRFRVFFGDKHMYSAHIHSLVDYHRVEPGDPIPSVIGRVQFCPNCSDIKSSSYSDRPVRNKNALGNGLIMLTGYGTTVCARCRKQASWKTKYRYENPDEDCQDIIISNQKTLVQSVETRERKKAKLISEQHLLSNCRTTETQTICIRGKIVMFHKTIYIGCFRCLRIIKLENAIYHEDNIICNTCMNYFRTHTNQDQRCGISVCSKKIKTKQDETCFTLVYDDLDPDHTKHQFKEISLCSLHSGFQWIRTGDRNQHILRTSDIYNRVTDYMLHSRR